MVASSNEYETWWYMWSTLSKAVVDQYFIDKAEPFHELMWCISPLAVYHKIEHVTVAYKKANVVLRAPQRIVSKKVREINACDTVTEMHMIIKSRREVSWQFTPSHKKICFINETREWVALIKFDQWLQYHTSIDAFARYNRFTRLWYLVMLSISYPCYASLAQLVGFCNAETRADLCNSRSTYNS